MNKSHADSLVGCLVGTAVGDALGLPYENMSGRRTRKFFRQPYRHRFVFRRGMVSDDTEHASYIAQALIQTLPDADRFPEELAKRLKLWILGLPGGTGRATARACFRLLRGATWEKSGVFSAGNGPSMRAAILGAAISDEELLKNV